MHVLHISSGLAAAARFALPVALMAGFGVATGAATAAPAGFQGENGEPRDIDAREGREAPSTAQRELVNDRGARARWTRFGTPRSLTKPGGYLATGLASDPVAAARRWIAQNRGVLGLTAAEAGELELVSDAPMGAGRALLLRQSFDGLEPGRDGLLALGVVGGKVAYVSSSLARDTGLTGEQRLSAQEALRAAAAQAGIEPGALTGERVEGGWTVFDAGSLSHPARARLVAVPTPTEGARRAWETELIDNGAAPAAFASFVDAETGAILIRESLVDHLADNPTWSVFSNTPPMDYASTDTRDLWCWLSGPPGCELALQNSASPFPWDVDARTGASTSTTIGNAARSVENWNSADPRTVGVTPATPRPNRDYEYAWTNQWHEQRCNPTTTFTSPQQNDIDAARANLFAMHNRMHDWAYHLGFTEQTFNLQDFNFGRGGAQNDPEQGNAQAGGIVGGPPAFAARDNANQITPTDGMPPITNMYLWQPIAGGFYAPCVDGDFDMSVIGHEYTHAISNRMVGGPSANLSGAQAGAMGESWSDLSAVEYLHENGFAPVGDENPFAVGPYVTGDKQAGIRNYGMNASPLNYSDVGYDFVCNDPACALLTQVHADGEIWSATNYDIRQAMNARYGAGDPALQAACARGERPVGSCPGNRRWAQLVFDAWLLMGSGAVSMLDARDAMLAADLVRFGGANQDLLWNAFAPRGFGENATTSTSGTNDADPVPSFESPFANESTVTFTPAAQAEGRPVQLFVGRYEARVTPIADTDPATQLGRTFRIAPGTYEFVARGSGFGTARVTATLRAGQVRDLPVQMFRNLASEANGATASGDGINLARLIDDTEATNWASLGSPIAGKQVTVRLDPGANQIRRVQVSAQLRTRLPADPGGDTASQNRYSALRQFQILACDAGGAVDCTQDAQFSLIFTSPADAFPSSVPRPRAPDLALRSFDFPRTKASHIRLRVLSNQCTGGPAYQGDQDDDPANITDCEEGSTQDDNVRVAEMQVFAQ